MNELDTNYIFAATFAFGPRAALKLSSLDLTQFPHSFQSEHQVSIHSLKLNGGLSKKLSYVTLVFSCNEAETCVEKIREAIYPADRVENILVLINPFGGTKG